MIKLVAFDWNGTILADTAATVKSDNFALKKLGLKTITLEQYRNAFEIPIVNYWKNLGYSHNFVKKNFKKLQSYYVQNYEKLESKCRTRAGVKESLSWVAKKNITAVIYSNHTKNHIQKQLDRLKISKFFTEIIAREINDVSHHTQRGKAQKLWEYLKKHQLEPKQIISVGDSEEEVEIANEYGYHSVALTGGWNSVQRLKKHKPNFLVHNLNKLIPIIKKLNRS